MHYSATVLWMLCHHLNQNDQKEKSDQTPVCYTVQSYMEKQFPDKVILFTGSLWFKGFRVCLWALSPSLKLLLKRKHNLSPYPADLVATVLGLQLVEENMFFRV